MTHQLFTYLITYLNSNPNPSIEKAGLALNVNNQIIQTLVTTLSHLGLRISINQKSEIVLTQQLLPLSISSIRHKIPKLLLGQLDFLPINLSINSTNQLLKDTQVELKNKTRICLTEHQTAGRGRQGKLWVSPFAQNIYLSMHTTLIMSVKYLGGISLMIGLAIMKAITSMNITGLKIKWPNDIYHEDKKLAGILIESTKIESGKIELIIGVGINVNMCDVESKLIDQAWTDLRKISSLQLDRNILIARIIEEIVNDKKRYQQTGLAGFINRWQDNDFLFNKEITVTYPDGKIIRGKAKGITDYGELQVLTNNNLIKLHAGEISVRKVAK